MLSMNSGKWFEVLAACHLAAFIAAPVNFRLTETEIAFVLGNVKPKLLFFEQQYAAMIPGLQTALPDIPFFICLDKAEGFADYEKFLASGDSKGPPCRSRSDDIIDIFHTSGTTGRPKGVVRTHAAELFNAEKSAAGLQMLPGGRTLISMPLFHVGGQGESRAQHWAGGTVILHRVFDPVAILRSIEKERVEVIHMAPTMVADMLAAPEIAGFDLSSLRVFCYAAAPMPLPILQRGIALLGPIFLNCYGSTEGGANTALHPHQHPLDNGRASLKRLQSVGQSYPGVDICIKDEEGNVCGPDVVGEICVRSPAVFCSYWNNNVATIEALREEWYHTGDLGTMDVERFIYLVDRKKDMIISGGENVYSREVEDALLENSLVQEAAVIGVPHPRWGEAVHALIVLAPGARTTEADIINRCGKQLARYKLPKTVEFAEALPRLASGKVNKAAIRASLRARSSS
ncbi:long-chain fatty acid--CoA ligase [Bradyrhizobium sp. KBS0727]|nr:long-chain fatty acid--CoA ligase [Bradyrhizobium sp. KBS0725]QDW48685.1 long-chain fatty acid--CoA ligase [Bradyrhizobium sp. KBS0727]